MKPLGPPKFVTFHCTANKEGDNVSAERIAEIDIARFGQESYHVVVTLDGVKHSRLPETVLGAHVGGHNTGNIGVSYVGGLDHYGKPKDTRTPAQRKALRELSVYYKAKYPGILLKGHRDWSPDLNHDGKIEPVEWLKSCPCFDVATDL